MANYHKILLEKILDNYLKTDPLKNGASMSIPEYKVAKETYVILMKEIIVEHGLTEELLNWIGEFDDETQSAVLTPIYDNIRKGLNYNESDIKNLIKYYESREEYEICSELVLIKQNNI